MEEKVLEELLKNKVFKKEEFLKTGNFKTLIGDISSSKNEEMLQKNLLRTIRTLQKKTTLGLNYQNPTIWLNYGLNSNNYSGSGSKEGLRSGFGSSILNYRFRSPSDIFLLIKEMLTEIIIYLSENIKELNPLWLKLVNEYDMPQENNYLTQLLGELYLKLMPPEKLQELQIRYKSNNPFDARSEQEKNSMPLDSIITNNLLPLALQSAAEYNTSTPPPPPEAKIYFEHTGDGRYVNISRLAITPASTVLAGKGGAGAAAAADSIDMLETLPHEEELQGRTQNLEFVRISLEELVQRLEAVIVERQPLPTNGEERKVFMERTFQEKLLEQREAIVI